MSATRDLGRRLFSFAVIADSHMNAAEDHSTSPYACNKLANARSRHVVAELNRLAPDFTVHLGDLVNPVPALPSYATAAAEFHGLYDALEQPLHLVAGNHDVGDKPAAWLPAPSVNDGYVALYEDHFGAHFYSFDHQGCHFVVINAQIINSGLACEAAQRAWLEDDLTTNASPRTFLFIHYPPFVAERGERGHYDNIDEPGRSWLLDLLAEHDVEALYAGHVHNFFYNRHAGTECYVLPSISFVRHDYSEFFHVVPLREHGRDDTPKLGYFMVAVHENGHVNHLIRTYGATLAPGETPPPAVERVAAPHVKEGANLPVGVDLRHPWASFTEIPPSGAVDEFGRKKARNDYPLMALWDMGIAKLRVPLHDLADNATRGRMADLAAIGHQFTVYSFGVPSPAQSTLVTRHAGLIAGWEVIVPWADAAAAIAPLRAAKADAPLDVLLSKLRSSADAETDGARFHHFINHGFHVREQGAIAALLETDGARQAVDGVVFRVPRETAPWDGVMAARGAAAGLGVAAAVHIRFSSDSPAEDFTDERANANRAAEALAAAHAAGGPDVILDTFMDLDRGYFVRGGLVDRLYNPRLAGRVFRHLNGALAELGGGAAEDGGAQDVDAEDIDNGRVCTLGKAALLLPAGPLTVATVPLGVDGENGVGRWIDLASGEIEKVDWLRSNDGAAIALAEPRRCETPVLFVGG